MDRKKSAYSVLPSRRKSADRFEALAHADTGTRSRLAFSLSKSQRCEAFASTASVTSSIAMEFPSSPREFIALPRIVQVGKARERAAMSEDRVRLGFNLDNLSATAWHVGQSSK